MLVFESMPEGIFGLDLSMSMTGSYDAAYLTWEALVRSGFVSGVRSQVTPRERVMDTELDSQQFVTMTGSDPSANDLELVKRLKGVCRQVSNHPALVGQEAAVFALAGLWLRSTVLNMTISGVLSEISLLHFGMPMSAVLVDHVVDLFDDAHVDAELLVLSLKANFEVSESKTKPFAEDVIDALGDFIVTQDLML